MKRAAAETMAEPSAAKKQSMEAPSREEIEQQEYKETKQYQRLNSIPVEKNHVTFLPWETDPSEIFVGKQNGNISVFVIKNTKGVLTKYVAKFKSPPGLPIFPTLRGIGEIPPQKATEAQGFVLLASNIGEIDRIKKCDADGKPVLDEHGNQVEITIKTMWEKTEALILAMKEKICHELAKHDYPNVGFKKTLCNNNGIEENEDPDVFENMKRVNKLQQLLSSGITHFPLSRNFKEFKDNRSDDGVISKLAFKMRSNSFKPLSQKEEALSFAQLYARAPEITKTLETTNPAEKEKQVYKWAVKVREAFDNMTPNTTGGFSRKKFVPVPVKRMAPIKDAQTGKFIKDSAGKFVCQEVAYGMFDDRLRRTDIVEVDFYVNVYTVGSGLNFKAVPASVYVIRDGAVLGGRGANHNPTFDGYHNFSDESEEATPGLYQLPPAVSYGNSSGNGNNANSAFPDEGEIFE